MSIIREHINEKFTEESDPIQDMGIGLPKIIKDWFISKGANPNKYDKFVSIDEEGKINIGCYLKLKPEWIENGELPCFINFGVIDGYFAVEDCKLTSMRGFPIVIKGNFICSYNYFKSLDYCPKKIVGDFVCYHNIPFEFTEEEIRKVCKILKGGKVILHEKHLF